MPCTSILSYTWQDVINNFTCQVPNNPTKIPLEIYGMAHDDVVKVLALAETFNDGQMFECPVR